MAWRSSNMVVSFEFMIAIATLMALIQSVSGTPYVPGGDSPAGTDCSGLASWVSNVATGRPAFGSRFHTGNEESALLSRGFQYGAAPNAVVIGWNSRHTAVTLPDGTPVSSGEGGGVRVGGEGAYQPEFTHHMFLPVDAEQLDIDLGLAQDAPPLPEALPAADPVVIAIDPIADLAPAPEVPLAEQPPGIAAGAPADIPV